MPRFVIAFVATLMVVLSAAFGSALIHSDPEHVKPDHVARPKAGVKTETHPFAVTPLEVVGGDSTIGAVSAWVEGELRHEQERIAAEVAAAEAERLEAARRTPSVGGTSGGARSSGACGSDWDCFRECTIDHESRSAGEYSTNTGNGYYGAFQFAQSTWNSVAVNAGYPEWAGRPASDAPKDVQDAVARFLWEHSGATPWGGRCG